MIRTGAAALGRSASPGTARVLRWLDRAALAATLLCPVFLVHGRGPAEVMIDVVAVAFLLRSTLLRDWRWTRERWVRAAALWWLWLLFCSLPFAGLGQGGSGPFLQAVLTLRFGLFAAALQGWILRPRGPRRLIGWLLAASFAYIAAQLLLQALLGVNLFGVPRFHDGTLTGPYDKPRAAAPLSRLLFPTLLPAAAWLTQRGRAGAPAALAVLLCGLAVMVLAGQRMPLLLSGLGLLAAGLLLPRLRVILLGCLAALPALAAASAVVSPRSFGHLVLLFERQMRHFGASPYGLIYARALAILCAEPLTGRGFDGFRTGCPDRRYFHGVWPLSPPASDGGGGGFCVQHAHNHYLQAATDAGLPGLALFCLMVLSWLSVLSRRGSDDPVTRAWRTGLFLAVLIQEWPIASSSAFTNMPLGGWFFLLLGLGLAAAPSYMQAPSRG